MTSTDRHTDGANPPHDATQGGHGNGLCSHGNGGGCRGDQAIPRGDSSTPGHPAFCYSTVAVCVNTSSSKHTHIKHTTELHTRIKHTTELHTHIKHTTELHTHIKHTTELHTRIKHTTELHTDRQYRYLELRLLLVIRSDYSTVRIKQKENPVMCLQSDVWSLCAFFKCNELLLILFEFVLQN